jgi:hypothetical protein
MDLPIAEFCSFFDEGVDVVVIQHVTGDGYGAATGGVDVICDLLCFLCEEVSSSVAR